MRQQLTPNPAAFHPHPFRRRENVAVISTFSLCFSRLGIQDAPRFAGGRWGKGCKTWLRSGDYLWLGLVPRSIPFAASFPPPTALCCSWAGGGGRGRRCWQFPRGLILPCLGCAGDERLRSLQGSMLPFLSHSPGPSGAVREVGVPMPAPCGVTQILVPPTLPAVAMEGA